MPLTSAEQPDVGALTSVSASEAAPETDAAQTSLNDGVDRRRVEPLVLLLPPPPLEVAVPHTPTSVTAAVGDTSLLNSTQVLEAVLAILPCACY